MIIVGSRCGGHDFYVDLPDKEPIWIGAQDNSDLDILIKNGEERSIVQGFRIDYWLGKLGSLLPHKNDERLFIPENLGYLQKVFKKRIRHKYGSPYIKSLWGKELNFLNRDGTFFKKIKITPHLYR